MGAAVSLPFISFFALPALTSTTTSVNILFFTLNWYILLLTHPPLSVEIIGLSVVQLLLYVLPGLLSLVFDTGIPSVAVAIKTQGDLALPSRLGRTRVTKIAAWSIFNVALGGALQAAIDLLLTKVLQLPGSLNLSKQMPMPWIIFKGVIMLLAIRGVLQYYAHRYLLHDRRSPLTKYHLSWAHSIASPFALCASYDFPLCYLVHQWAPLFIPAILLRVHFLTLLFTLSLTSLESLVTYSGYSILPSGILLPGMARRVDHHFVASGEGNFAAFGALDWVHSTSLGDDVVDDMKAEWEKHNDQVLEAGEGAGKFIEGLGDRIKSKTGGKRKKSTST